MSVVSCLREDVNRGFQFRNCPGPQVLRVSPVYAAKYFWPVPRRSLAWLRRLMSLAVRHSHLHFVMMLCPSCEGLVFNALTLFPSGVRKLSTV